MKEQEIKIKISVPDGFRAENVRVENNIICFETVPEFKDGDIIYCSGDKKFFLFIYKKNVGYTFYHYYIKGDFNDNNTINIYQNDWGNYPNCRLSTEKEKQLLFDAMAKEGLIWDEEKKEVVKKRWRANQYEYYFSVDHRGVVHRHRESYSAFDNENYEYGNYFQTEEKAEQVAKEVKEVFAKYK